MKVQEIDAEQTAKNLRRLRKQSGISVKEMTDAGLNRSCIYDWETGRYTPGIDSLVILSDLYNVPFEEIIAMK